MPTKFHIAGRPLSLFLITAYKGIFGFFEIIIGATMLFAEFFLGYFHLIDILKNFIGQELIDDPQDLFINWLLSINFSGYEKIFFRVGLFLIILGAIKLFMAYGLWFRSMTIRNIGIYFFSGVAIYGLYNIATNFSFFKFIALALDIFILYYFWKVLPKHIRHAKA